jgi:hypothetical protein
MPDQWASGDTGLLRSRRSGRLQRFKMETFAIVSACDDQFAQHTSVMLRSLIENNPKTTFRIFVLVPSNFHPNIETMIQAEN